MTRKFVHNEGRDMRTDLQCLHTCVKLANKRKGLEWKAIDWKPVISVGQYCVTYVMEGLEERKILGEVASVSAIAAPRVFSWMYLCE